ncbi:hypothetical protein POTOM_008332 [Populus tomentosa]|uniref:Response regulatory domain-containing protein n=1 Tax=Populus tomentosa TaxID=118781 RepID=A0A8X8AH95_POPTO|nr:hypothetical protein POTOM_008332 [Populus tomentosa]
MLPYIEAGFGLKGKHLIAISLFVGNDHDLNGVQGVGLEKACYVKLAMGTNTPFQIGSKVVDDLMLGLDESLVKSKTSHCSFCGHPNIKRAHLKSTCEYCGTSNIQDENMELARCAFSEEVESFLHEKEPPGLDSTSGQSLLLSGNALNNHLCLCEVILSIHNVGSTRHERTGSSHFAWRTAQIFSQRFFPWEATICSVPDMTSEQFLSVEVTKNNASSLGKGIRILVVESDPTCLRIVSKMLQAFGYEAFRNVVERCNASSASGQGRFLLMPCVPRSQPDPMFNNKHAMLECCTKFKKNRRRGFVAFRGGVEGVGDVAGNPFLRFQGRVCDPVLRFTTATRATDALHILREKEDEINLIMIETHLPDMDQYEIIGTVRAMSSLPIVVFSADNNVSAMLGWLYKGAALYLMKPIVKNDVKNLWQLTYRKKKKITVSSVRSNSFHAGLAEENASSVTTGIPSLLSTTGQSDQMGKRKELEETDIDDEDNDNLTVLKKPELVWTNELHNRFLQAIRILGKYRLSLKWEQDATQKTMIRDHHPSLTLNLQGGFSQFTNPQFFMAISQSEHTNNIQNYLCSPASMHSLGSAHSLTRVNTNYDGMLIPSYGQQSKQLDRTYPNCSHTGIGTTNDGNFASLGQKGNHNVEEHLNQGTTFSNVGTHGPTFLGRSQQQLQFPLLQPQPLPEKEDESDIPNIVTEARNELLVMKNEFLDDPNNDLW